MLIIAIESQKDIDKQKEKQHIEVKNDIETSMELNCEVHEKVEENSFESIEEKNFNVIFPSENTQPYFPVMEFTSLDGEVLNELELIRLAIERDRNDPLKHITTFYFFSPPGLGKTVLGSYLSKCYQCPFQVINCVSSMIDLDLLGSQVLIGDETKWQDGPIPSIIKATNYYGMGILLINELNALTVNAQMCLNPLLDKQEGVVLTQNNNEFIQIDQKSHLLIIASMNPDVLGINDLQDSVRDRASAIIQMSYPTIEKESWLIEKLTHIEKEWAIQFCEVIAECRKAKYIDRTLTNVPSTRALIDWVNYSQVWGVSLAFELTIANRYCSGINIEEKDVYMRIAAGKGIKKWDLPEDFFDHTLLDKDPFFFPIPEDFIVKKIPKISREQKKTLSKKEKKILESKKQAERLKIDPLDHFLA